MNPRLALTGSITALGVVVGIGILVLSSSGSSEYATILEEKLVARLEKIEKSQAESAQRLESLENRWENVTKAASSPSVAPNERTVELVAAPKQADIVARVEKIEKQALQVSAKEASSIEANPILTPGNAQRVDLASLQLQATNGSLPISERVGALATLRSFEGGRTREVVLSMVDSVRSSQDHRSRRDIIRNLHHTHEPELKSLLIDILNDPNDDESVRAKCAEDIDVFLDDAAAHAALLYVAQNDKSSKVKSAAYEALAKWEESKLKKKKKL